jgi:hypothetical protein
MIFKILCKLNFTGMQSNSFIYILPVTAFVLQMAVLKAETVTAWLVKSKIFTTWLFTEKV